MSRDCKLFFKLQRGDKIMTNLSEITFPLILNPNQSIRREVFIGYVIY